MAEKTVYIIDLDDRVRKKLQGVQEEGKKTDSVFAGIKSALGPIAGLMAGAFAISRIAGFGKEVIQTTAHFQSLRNSIKFASDTSQQGEISMNWIGGISKKFGLPLTETAEGFKTFQGAMMKTKFTSSEVRTMFEQVSTGVVAMGLGADDAKGIFLALGQIMGKGKVQAEELRGQIGERVPGAFAVAARAMNMSSAELDKFMSDGKLLAEDFLPKFAEEMEKTFGQGAIDNSDSLTASLNRSSNAWTELTLAMGNSDSEGLIGSTLSHWTDLVDNLADSFRNIDQLVKKENSLTVEAKIKGVDAQIREQADFMKNSGMSKKSIEENLKNSQSLELFVSDKKIKELKEAIGIAETDALSNRDEAGVFGRLSYGEKLEDFNKDPEKYRKYFYQEDDNYRKLRDELELTEAVGTARQGMVDKVISSMYIPANGLASKTKKQGLDGLSLNESKNGSTHINITIDTFQKNEFNGEGTNVTNTTTKRFLDQMALGLQTVLNDSQIVARQ